MNCIFICVFNNPEYIKILYLLLESIYIYGNLNDETEILIYTSTKFMEIIKKSHLFSNKIFFEINDTYDTVDKACKSRIDLFQLQISKKYDKFLYLDTDVIVKRDISRIFDIATENKMYVLQEGSIDCDIDYWGKSLFTEEELNKYEDKSAFSSSILLFKNCDKIKQLFQTILDDMQNRYHGFYDQPFIIYNAFKYECFENTKLSQFAINNSFDINTEHSIHHFAGGVGDYIAKKNMLTMFLNDLKEKTIQENISITKEYINTFLLPIIYNCGEKLEGNIFMSHHSTEYADRFILKTKNISNLVLGSNIKNVMEIGFNAGFSTLLMLISNPKINITCYDICVHSYTDPCFQKIKSDFGDRINIVYGDSTQTLKNVNDITYDLIHIDGGHGDEAEHDIVNSYRLSREGTILIMDDYDFPNLAELWDKYTINYKLKPLNILLYDNPYHDVKAK